MADTDDLVFPVQGEAVDYPQVAPPPAPEPLPTIPVSVTQATNGALNPAQQPTNIAPLDQASSGRISGHAEAETLPNVAPATGDQPDIKPAANIDKDTRFEYTRALTNGEVNDPQDFAERAAGIAGSMAAEQSQSAPTSDEHSQTVNAAKALADALPSHEDLIDHGIALSNQVYGQATPTTVAVIKQNLLDAWVETGVKPDDLVRAAYTEPDLAARLAMPQPTPWQQSPHMPTSDELGQSSTFPDLAEWLVRLNPTAGVAKGVAEGVTGQEPKPVSGVAGAFTLPEDIGNIVGKQVPAVAKLITRVMNPEYQSRLLTGEATAADHEDALQAAMLGLGGTPAGAVGSGIGRGIGAFVKPEVGEAIQGAAIRTGLGRFFPATGGLGGELGNVSRARIRKNVGQSRNAKDIVTDLLTPYRKEINRLAPEDRQYQRDIAAYAQARAAAKEAWVAQEGAYNHPDDFKNPPGLDEPPPSRLQVLRDHMEQRPGGGRIMPGDALYGLSEVIGSMMKSMRAEIERHYDIEGFYEHYLPHVWKDRSALNRAFGSARQGTARALNHRTVPYIYDGLVRGLEMAHPDFLEGIFHYVQGLTDYMAAQRTIADMEKTGELQWYRPGSRDIPDGWEPLKGIERAGTHEKGETLTDQQRAIEGQRDIPMAHQIEGGGPAQTALPRNTLQSVEGHAAPGQRQLEGPAGIGHNQGPPLLERRRAPDKEVAYAHPATARIFNNWQSKGFYQWKYAAPIAENLQFAANASTALKLGLSGAHLFNIIHEEIASGFALAFGEMSHGEIKRGLKDMGMTLTLFPRIAADAMKGHNFQQLYLGKVQDMTPLQQQMRQAFIDAGGRPMGRGQEMAVGNAINLWSQLHDGGLGPGFREYLYRRFGEPGGSTLGVLQAIKQGANVLGDIVHTLSAPMFDSLIPKLKAAAWANEMEAWARAHPQASESEWASMARTVMDSADDRFGELNMENIFMNRAGKQVANMTLLSTGWWYGTARAFGRGIDDLLHGRNTTRARWLLGLPVSTAMVGTLYQIIKGQGIPTSFKDLYLPRTGGTLPDGQTERDKFLSPWKEFLDAYSAGFSTVHSADPTLTAFKALGSYAAGKGNPMTRAVLDLITAEPGQEWHQQIMRDLAPIMSEQGSQRGTANTFWDQYFGFTPGPRSITDPAALGAILDKQAKKQTNTQAWRDWYANQNSANPVPMAKPPSDFPAHTTGGGRINSGAAPKAARTPRQRKQ